jgi:hypothetical protein
LGERYFHAVHEVMSEWVTLPDAETPRPEFKPNAPYAPAFLHTYAQHWVRLVYAS